MTSHFVLLLIQMRTNVYRVPVECKADIVLEVMCNVTQNLSLGQMA